MDKPSDYYMSQKPSTTKVPKINTSKKAQPSFSKTNVNIGSDKKSLSDEHQNIESQNVVQPPEKKQNAPSFLTKVKNVSK